MLVYCPRCEQNRSFKTCLLGIKITPQRSSHIAHCEDCSLVVVIKIEVVRIITREVLHDDRQPTA